MCVGLPRASSERRDDRTAQVKDTLEVGLHDQHGRRRIRVPILHGVPLSRYEMQQVAKRAGIAHSSDCRASNAGQFGYVCACDYYSRVWKAAGQ
jgi:hypothetical protein